ncbi:hypothetical protein [Streptomyces sp. OK228]|uniref:hypothetical protein n=1 Tax=Streptomyces sp. OK228 TaxID=1882786 RepID=UPI00117F990F|nr:hypothetical protein [Streptomyces sp. OK228]
MRARTVEHDAVEPRADGATLVTTVPVPPRTERKDRWTTSRDRKVQWAFGALFALGTALAAATGEWTFRESGRLVATDPERIEVTYDPCAPKRMTARDGPVVRALSVLAYVLLGLPVTAATAAYPPVSLIVLLSAL